MKFFNIVLLALAAMVQADPIPEPEPGLLDKVSSFISDVRSNVESHRSTRTDASELIASLTSEAGPRFSSLESVASTAFGNAASSVHSEISKLSKSLASATSSAASAASKNRSKDAAPAPTAFVAMGALVGGAAVLVNL